MDGVPLKSSVREVMPTNDEDFEDEDFDEFDGTVPIDDVGFEDPGGHSALRRATPNNPRNLPCPTCKQPNKLTPLDVRAGYQCDDCADRDEGLFG